MVFLLSLLSFISMAAGVFGLGLGVPIRETWFGAALLMAGSVAITGGFILVGLAAAVRELRQVVHGFKAPLSGMPRPVRPLERRDRERVEGAHGWTESRLMLGAVAPDAIPAGFDAADLRERWQKPGPEEWLRHATAEIESAPRQAHAVPPSIDYHASDIQRPSNPWPRPATPLPPDHSDREMRWASAASPRDTFDTIWSSQHRNPEERPEPRIKTALETGLRAAEPRSPPLAPVQPAASASTRPEPVEPRPLPILKSGVIQQMAYTLFTDGSVETQMPEGVMRFASIEEFLGHLEKSNS